MENTDTPEDLEKPEDPDEYFGIMCNDYVVLLPMVDSHQG